MKKLQLVAALAAVWLFMFLSGRAWSAARSAVAIESASASSLLQRPLRAAQRDAEGVWHALQRVAGKLDQTSARLQRKAQEAPRVTVADIALPAVNPAERSPRALEPTSASAQRAYASPHATHALPDELSHIPGFAARAAAPPLRPSAGRSWLDEGNPFYKPRDSGHTCRKLGRVRFTEPRKTGGSEPPAGSTGKRTLELEFPPWTMAWPHMVSQQHADWFKNFEIADWRRRRCVPLARCQLQCTHTAAISLLFT